jgi:Fe-S-cluster containining protein
MPLPAGDQRLIQIMDAAWSDAARRAGPHLACRLGCTQCCHGAFTINALDAARLRAGMDALRSTDPARAAQIERRAQSWTSEHAAAFPGDRATGILGTSEADQLAFEDFANDAACPALNPATGACDVYTWRPMNCRVFGPPVRIADDASPDGALGCCELCFTTATDEEIAACEMHAPHDVEATLLDDMQDRSQTIVAYALLNPAHAPTR